MGSEVDATPSRNTCGEAVDMAGPAHSRIGLSAYFNIVEWIVAWLSAVGSNWNLSRDWSEFRSGGSHNGIRSRDHSHRIADLWEFSEVAMVFLGIPWSLRFSCGIPD